jgi:hypothetical protein
MLLARFLTKEKYIQKIAIRSSLEQRIPWALQEVPQALRK